jgi:tetratricopeptide (TPR) repeat protein
MKNIRYLLVAALLAACTMNAETASANPLAAASAALGKGDLTAAETLAAPLTQGETARADACALLGDIRLRQKRVKEAIELLEQAAKIDPATARYQSRLGEAISLRMGEVNFVQQAVLAGRLLAAFKRSVEIDPENVPGYIGLSRYYQNAPAIAGGSMEKAVAYAEEVRKRDVFLGTLESGFIAERRGELEQALGYYEEALSLHPEQAWLHEQTGHVLAKLGRTAGARACFEKAIELDAKRESARQALAALPAT